ncbi:MAG: 16S rRNA (adenine(1518)-N(6)/adenine(1519)-N(6))-dimethyltransferase RsmA [Candidatus Margulisbacteria bacterium]|nr:16S rRNA (adenine(1518)-N(6)/adenine(1519)-N(6))-dimethyltransferase RsmA [Candidatus Margulisiibacteriota bacterium]
MKKSLGQNFLFDKNIREKIIGVIPRNYPVLEIGTGSGLLTEILAQNIETPIYSYEIDRLVYEQARTRLQNYKHVQLFLQDFLESDFTIDKAFIVVANIPYYITTPIIEKCLQYPLLKDMYLMVQKEIAQRITARPGEKDYSSLAIFCQTRAKVKKLFNVSRNSFYPVPNVDSAYIQITPAKEFLTRIKDISVYNAIIRSAFWGKRKTLLNCLNKSPYMKTDKNILLSIFNKMKLKETIRGEDLEIDTYIELSNLIGEHHKPTA